MAALTRQALLLIAAANLAAAPYYEARELHLTGLPEDPAILRSALGQALEEHHVAAALRGTPTAVADLPLGCLQAFLVATTYDLDGAEADLVVGTSPDTMHPVTIYWQEGVLDCVPGPSGQGLRLRGGTGPELQERFGIGPLRDAGAQWTAFPLALLDDALSRLSAGELEALRGLPFDRRPTMTDDAGNSIRPNVSAAFFADPAGPRVEVYDAAVAPTNHFVGEPDAPRPDSTRVILHEVGHAVARIVHVRALVEAGRLRPVWRDLRRRWEAARADPTVDAATRSERAGKLAEDAETVRVAIDKLVALSDPKKETASEAALARLLGKDGSPTAYGRTSPRESFAECFALYHTDRAALVRAAPKAVAFFDEGRHITLSEPETAEVKRVVDSVPRALQP